LLTLAIVPLKLPFSSFSSQTRSGFIVTRSRNFRAMILKSSMSTPLRTFVSCFDIPQILKSCLKYQSSFKCKPFGQDEKLNSRLSHNDWFESRRQNCIELDHQLHQNLPQLHQKWFNYITHIVIKVKYRIEDDVGRDAHDGDSHGFAHQRTPAITASSCY
jgi:hypothetical protein